ncbi:hypothetical protein ATCC90586_011451 [Pythium insidiosum]|nr:hypothetical protein ATCC90586_011451 [Pythium insidiosum]
MATAASSPTDISDHDSLRPLMLPRPEPKTKRRTLSPEERASRRRKQHRELVARGRARLRARVEELQRQEELLQRTVDSAVRSFMMRVRRSGYAQDGESLSARFMHAVALQESLRLENDRLVESIERHRKFQDTVRQANATLLPSSPDAVTDTAAASTKTRDVRAADAGPALSADCSSWIFFTGDDEPFYFAPYSSAECDALLSGMRRDAMALDDAFRRQQYPTAVTRYFGWRVQRILDPSNKSLLRFHFNRVVPAARADGAARETWQILNDPERYAKLYRTAVVVHVVQRVDERTSIVVRNNPDHEQTTRLRSISLMRIVEDVDAIGRPVTTILVHVLPPQNEASVARQACRGVMYIRQGFTYMRFVRVDDASVEVTYGGMGQCPSEDHAVYLLMELGCAWFRWEQVVMPTRLVAMAPS